MYINLCDYYKSKTPSSFSNMRNGLYSVYLFLYQCISRPISAFEVFMHFCVYVATHVCPLHKYACSVCRCESHTCMYIPKYLSIYIYIWCVCACVYLLADVFASTCACACVHASMCTQRIRCVCNSLLVHAVRVCVCARARACARACVWSVCACARHTRTKDLHTYKHNMYEIKLVHVRCRYPRHIRAKNLHAYKLKMYEI